MICAQKLGRHGAPILQRHTKLQRHLHKHKRTHRRTPANPPSPPSAVYIHAELRWASHQTDKKVSRERETERKSGIALFFFTTLGPPSPRTATIRGGHGCGHHDREQMVEMAVFEGNYGIFVIAPLTAPMYCVKLYRDLGGSTYYVLDCHINTCKARNFLKFSSS